MFNYYLIQIANHKKTNIANTCTGDYEMAKKLLRRTINAILINCHKHGIMVQTRQSKENEIKLMMHRDKENYKTIIKIAQTAN